MTENFSHRLGKKEISITLATFKMGFGYDDIVKVAAYTSDRFEKQKSSLVKEVFAVESTKNSDIYPHRLCADKLLRIKQDILDNNFIETPPKPKKIRKKALKTKKSKAKTISVSQACLELGYSKHYSKEFSAYTKDRYERQQQNPELPIFTFGHIPDYKKHLKNVQPTSYRYKKDVIKKHYHEIRKDVHEQGYISDLSETMSCSEAIVYLGFLRKKHNVKGLVAFAGDELEEQNKNPKLEKLIIEYEPKHGEYFPYRFSKKILKEDKEKIRDKIISKGFIKDHKKFVSCTKAIVELGFPRKQKYYEMFLAYAEHRIERQSQDPKLDIWITENGTNPENSKNSYRISQDVLDNPKLKDKMIKEMIDFGFYLPRKEENELDAKEILEQLGYKTTNSNKKKVNGLLSQLYDNKSLLVFKRAAKGHRGKPLCVYQQHIADINEALFENNVDLTPTKQPIKKQNAYKIAI